MATVHTVVTGTTLYILQR